MLESGGCYDVFQYFYALFLFLVSRVCSFTVCILFMHLFIYFALVLLYFRFFVFVGTVTDEFILINLLLYSLFVCVFVSYLFLFVFVYVLLVFICLFLFTSYLCIQLFRLF